jgi:uncharacterized protein YyaL (SSP411 family)
MFVAALAEAGAVLGRRDWIDEAEAVAGFLEEHLRRPGDGRWMRSWQIDGGARHLAYAGDHAWLVDAFTRLAEATGKARWIAAAVETAGTMLELFGDGPDAAGGLFTTAHDGETLIVRPKDLYDGAVPAANSVAALALARLGALTGEARFVAAARAIVGLLGDDLVERPLAYTNFLAAAELLSTGVTEVAVTGERPDLVAAYRSRFVPGAVLAWGERFASPLWDGRRDGFAYVCRDYVCQAPVAAADALVAQLSGTDSSTARMSSP